MKTKHTYIMENVAQAFRHESDIWSFTPYEQIERNVYKFQLLSVKTFREPEKCGKEDRENEIDISAPKL